MDKEKISEKLKKIKALAEQGVGGEKETALRMYNDLMNRYGVTEDEVLEDVISTHWFGYTTELEKDLLTQIFFKVTGSSTYRHYTGEYKRRKKRGCDCTEFEAAEIKFYFEFYRKHLTDQLWLFKVAFFNTNHLFPDKTARLYRKNKSEKELTREEKRRLRQAGAMADFMDSASPIRLIGEPDEE